MSIAYLLILAVLVYIAYQLLQLNQGRKYDLALKAAEIKENELHDLFPHLYPNANEDAKEEIRNFLQQDIDNLAKYIYLEPFKQMRLAIEAEIDIERKAEMQLTQKSLVEDMKRWRKLLEKAVDERKATQREADFVTWSYLNDVNENFPLVDKNMGDFMFLSSFKKLLSLE